MAITGVSELTLVGRQFVQALNSDGAEVTGEGSVLCENHRSSGHEAVDERIAPHQESKTQQCEQEEEDDDAEKRKKKQECSIEL